MSQTDEGRCLVHCFGCGDAVAVLQAVGLCLADLYPVRLKPQTPEERRTAQRAARQSQWGAALDMLALESNVALIAAGELLHDRPLTWDDFVRLVQACDRIQSARDVLRDPPRWKPEVRA
ncbi:hypothetical protein [Dokdonella sp.]|uniref:hypothetical protein n=1 Tax=Dokdonella sp. TaxID=2291710 RepID=UPI003527E5D4